MIDYYQQVQYLTFYKALMMSAFFRSLSISIDCDRFCVSSFDIYEGNYFNNCFLHSSYTRCPLTVKRYFWRG